MKYLHVLAENLHHIILVQPVRLGAQSRQIGLPNTVVEHGSPMSILFVESRGPVRAMFAHLGRRHPTAKHIVRLHVRANAWVLFCSSGAWIGLSVCLQSAVGLTFVFSPISCLSEKKIKQNNSVAKIHFKIKSRRGPSIALL